MKVKRARHLIAELRAEFDRYVNSNPLSATPVVDPEGLMSFELKWKGLGLWAGAILGDAIHNLRTSLDQMASELARINDKTDKDVYFPFSDKEDTFSKAIKAKNFTKAGADAVHLLRKFAPYRGGNEELRAIHDLDIADKHSALIATAGAFGFDIEVHTHADPMQNVYTVIPTGFFFQFPEGSKLAGRDIVETLEQLVELVEGILEAFAGLVSSRA